MTAVASFASAGSSSHDPHDRDKPEKKHGEPEKKRHGWKIVSVFKDEGISGFKGREQRPGFEELKAKNVDLYLQQQGMDTSTPQGRMLFQMSGVFAEFERAMIVERVKAGLRRAKAEGTQLGRPRVSAEIEGKIREQLALGLGIHRVAKVVGCGSGTVQRVQASV